MEYKLTEEMESKLSDAVNNAYINLEDIEAIRDVAEELHNDICITSELEDGNEAEMKSDLSREYAKARVLLKAIMKLVEEVENNAANLEQLSMEIRNVTK